jgi:RimJ/RimL family protein N-acetyltransferase
MSVDVPEITTERLRLRAWRESDFDAHAAMSADPEVTRFVGGVRDRETAWRHMATHVGHWQLRGYGNWAVELIDDGEFIGRVGLWQPEGWPGLELGWKLARRTWGRGLATEAARAARDWAWIELDATRLISLIHPDNAASIAVAAKLGMAPDGHVELGGSEVLVYAVERGA